jgi:hypothetical protein
MTTSTGIKAGKSIEACFEYSFSLKETVETGNRRIYDPEDERWDDELQKAPFKGCAEGYVRVEEVVRVEGEIVKTKLLKGWYTVANTAREYLRDFHKGLKAGATRPWDTEHFHRDMLERKQQERLDNEEQDRSLIAAALGKLAGAVQPQQEITK